MFHMIFLSIFRQRSSYYIKICHDRLLTNSILLYLDYESLRAISPQWTLQSSKIIQASVSGVVAVATSTVFVRSNAEIMGSNSTQGIDVCVRLFCICVVLCVDRGLATGWSPVQGVLRTVEPYIYRWIDVLTNQSWSEIKFHPLLL
jgi:hypothetical protein